MIRPESLYSATALVFNSPDKGVPVGGSPLNFYRKVTDGQSTKRYRNFTENFNRLSRALQTTDRQTDDRRQTGDRRTDDDI